MRKVQLYTTASSELKLPYRHNRLWQILSLIYILAWMGFGLTTRDATNWWIENILVLLFVPWWIRLQKKITLSNLSFVCIFLFLLIHAYGAQMSYTYNEAGAWVQEKFQLSRNPYDRFVHFNFGFLIAYPLYEYLIVYLKMPLRYAYWSTVSLILCMATIFELIEWMVAATTDSETGETYVATQGDVWDAHKDIALAWLASMIVMLALYLYKKRKKRAN